MDAIELEVRIERKAPSLPTFVVVPEAALIGWGLEGTTPVEARLDGIPIGRRTLKRWGRGRPVWFLDIPEQTRIRAGLEVGRKVELRIERGEDGLPEELADLIRTEAEAAARWASLTLGRRRSLCEHVRGAARVDTRIRRARRALLD